MATTGSATYSAVVAVRRLNQGRFVRRNTLTPEQMQQAADAYQRLGNVRNVAAQLGLSYAGTHYRLQRAGVNLGTWNRVTAEDDAEIRRLRVDHGLSVRAIARETGLTRGTVQSRLKRAGIQLRQPTPPSTNELLLETERVFQREGSRSKVAKALGVADSTVHRRLNQLAERRDRRLIAPPES